MNSSNLNLALRFAGLSEARFFALATKRFLSLVAPVGRRNSVRGSIETAKKVRQNERRGTDSATRACLSLSIFRRILED